MAAVWVMVTYNLSGASADTALGALLLASLATLFMQSALLTGPVRQQLGTGNATTEVRE